MRWLSVAISSHDLVGAVSAVRRVGDGVVGSRLIHSDDCANFKPGMFVLAGPDYPRKEAASKDVERWRERGVKDAYARSCHVRANSLVSLGIPVLDSSFVALTETPVNWDLPDAVARVEPLGNGWVAVVAPYYVRIDNDIREGLRIKVFAAHLSSGRSVALGEDCIDPKFVYSAKGLAVTCATETAADELLHTVRIFDLRSASIIGERLRCRNPSPGSVWWTCLEEQIDRAGVLHLKESRIPKLTQTVPEK